MSRPSIALSRFGYGLSAGDTPPADPRRFLLAQLAAYDPAPAAIAGRMRSRGETGSMVELVRSLRQDRRAAMAMDSAPEAMGAPSDDPRAAALAGLPPEYRDKLAEARKVLAGDIAARTQIAVSSPTPMAERLVHKAAVLHPAMLLYLDQFQSIGPNAPFAQRRARRGGDQGGRPRGLNENLAREVLELHTLGVDGGYTQADVTEFARALTGWTVPGVGRVGRFAEDQPSGAAFVALVHEPGARWVLGRAYPAGEARQALAILDDLAAHPATARHIATKFARHFAGDTPPPALVARLEADFLRTGGDLASLTTTLIDAPEAWTPAPVKFRAPFEWLVGALRLTGINTLPPQRIVGALNQLGQVPWRAPSPAGYDDLAASWAGPDALVRRVEMAERIAGNVPADDVLARAEAAFPGALGEATRTQLKRAESGSQALALLLVSPEMMRR